uniref:Putative secreted peptide n=1 Tax=Anopheles braziliensis TaxID=58242 RepID=A0A2M3ZW19_9DIPT
MAIRWPLPLIGFPCLLFPSLARPSLWWELLQTIPNREGRPSTDMVRVHGREGIESPRVAGCSTALAPVLLR